MNQRCSNPANTSYPYYGGRGIQVCPEWKESFPQFLKDVGIRPSANHSLDRINVDDHYRPGNVRWATASQQQSNRRISAHYSFKTYQTSASKTAVYPGIGEIGGIFYTALGLVNEAGELCGVVKKIIRDRFGEVSAQDREKVLSEGGDVLWYLSQLCKEFGISLPELAKRNLEKLADRKARGVIQGSGDNR